MLKQSQKRMNRAPLTEALDVERPREHARLVRDDAHAPPGEPREAHDDVPRVMLLDLEQDAPVDDAPGSHSFMSYGLPGSIGDQAVESRLLPVRRVVRWPTRGGSCVLFCGQVGEELAHLFDAGGIVRATGSARRRIFASCVRAPPRLS